MKILIIGSGQVGSTVAQNLASSSANDVTIVDLDEKALHRIGSRLDVQTIVGNGASPFVLEQAGAADSDLLLALTRSDETNIVACKIAADLFNIPSRIARVRSAEYLEYLHPSADGGEEADSLSIFDITETISPEQLVTEQLVGLLSYTSALQVLRFSDDGERGIGADGFIRTAGGTQSEQQQEGVSLHSVSIMVVGNVAFEMVTRPAVGAFDVAVGLNREEDARMTVPSFVVGTGAVQRQVFGVDNDGFGVCVHDFSLVSPTLLYDISPVCAAQKVV